jgi:two-component sensor histidine kinase
MLSEIKPALRRSDFEVVSLVVDELVTNAIRHGCMSAGDIDVGVACGTDRCRVEVAQPGRNFDPNKVRVSPPGKDRGWGIVLVDHLTESWGVDRSGVWAEIPLTDESAPN